MVCVTLGASWNCRRPTSPLAQKKPKTRWNSPGLRLLRIWLCPFCTDYFELTSVMALTCKRHVQAEFGYLADIPLWKVEKPYAIDQVPGTPDGQITNIQIENHLTTIGDLRSCSVLPTLSEHSFTFLEAPSGLSVHSEEEMMTSYADEVNKLLRGIFGTDRVITYDLRVCQGCSILRFLLSLAF